MFRNTETIQSRLIQVAEKLRSDEKYEIYAYLLPVMEFDAANGRQKIYELNLQEDQTNRD